MSQYQSGQEQPPRHADHAETRSDSEAGVHATPVTRQGFDIHFDRYFSRVYAYVSRRVSEKRTCERIVSEVLTGKVHLFVEGADECRSLFSLEAFADRLIELEATRKASVEMLMNQQAGH